MIAPELETKVSKAPDDILVLVEASRLSLDDEFMKYKPTTWQESQLKELLEKAISHSVKDFYRPCMDPSFDKDGSICYKARRSPAVDKSYIWWEHTAEGFMPERGSRLGTRFEYVAFLGVLIKDLVSEGWSIKKAWNAVCNDSKKLGHYWNSKNAKYALASTGTRKVGRFYDLINTSKILAEDEKAGGFWLASGYYLVNSTSYPLADLLHFTFNDHYRYNNLDHSVGWVVVPAA